MTWALLMYALAAAPVRVEPATLTFGPAAAPLELVVPGATAVKVWCGACGGGVISAAEPAGEGRFRARFTFPQERFPRVVLLAVESIAGGSKGQLRWVALPLLANASLKLETKPRASVTVAIGTSRFGPMLADGRGKLTLPVVVPPGFASASVVAADAAGNITTTSVDLAPRPYPRAAALVPVEGLSAASRVELEVFAVELDGAPLLDAAKLRLSARRGALEAPIARAGGVFSVGYRAPRSVAGGPDALGLSVEGSPETVVEVAVRAASAASIALTLTPGEFTAGSGVPVEVVATVKDLNGNVVSGPVPTISADFGELRAGRLTVPDVFGDRSSVQLRAAAPGLSGEATLRLSAGPPVTAELKLPGQVAAGRQINGTLWVKDAWGNPAGAQAVTVVGPSGRLATVSAAARGTELTVGYQTDEGETVGPQAVVVRAGERTLTQTELTVFSSQRDWALAAGAFVTASSNFTQARAISPRVSLAVRLAGLPLEVGAEGSFAWFPRLSQARTVDGSNTVDVDMSAWSAAVVLRYSLQVAIRWSLQLCLTAGAQHTQATFTAPGLTTLTDARWGPLLRGAGGVALHALGGRLLLQLEYGYAPLGEGNVRGNSAGAGVALGYLVGF